MFEYDPYGGRYYTPNRRSVRAAPAGGSRAPRPELEDGAPGQSRDWPVTPASGIASNRADIAKVVAGLQNQIDELTRELRAAQAAAREWQAQAEAAQRETAGWQKQYQAAQREAGAWQAHAASVQDEADTWQAQLTTAQQELQSAQNALATVQAESAELRTRWQKRFADEAAQEKQRFVLALLPFIDHLELAIEHDRGDDAGLRGGVETTLRGVLHTLAQLGITPLHALNQPFDPTVHEAVAVIPAADAAPGTVVQVVQKGYLANQQLLRPARVVVSQ